MEITHMHVDGIEQWCGTCRHPDTNTGRENLGETVETQDTSGLTRLRLE